MNLIYKDIGTDLINEMEVVKNKSAENTTPIQNSYNNKVNANYTLSIADSKNKNNKISNIAKSAAEKEDNSEIEAIKSGSSLYLKACGNALGTKCTLSVAIYKEFMQILRWHVGEVGNKQPDRAVQQGTNYADKSTTNKITNDVEKTVERLKVGG